jgi:hypothetical protein
METGNVGLSGLAHSRAVRSNPVKKFIKFKFEEIQADKGENYAKP